MEIFMKNFTASTTISTTINNEVLLLTNEDLVWEVFLRLPAKSLMRFKCISKHWNSIIRNPMFAKSYMGGFRGLLITHVKPRVCNHPINAKRFFYASCYVNNSNTTQAYHRLSLNGNCLGCRYYIATNIVNGLFGLYADNHSCEYSCFALCNIATHERLDHPNTFLEKYSRHYLGFDPVTEVYKVLKLFLPDREYGAVRIQICTIGGGGGGGNSSGWRGLYDPTPHLDYITIAEMQSICINGILYLLSRKYHNNRCQLYPILLAFDLNTETFSSIIEIPDCLFEETILVQLGASAALISLPSRVDQMNIIWTMEDNNKTLMKSQNVDLRGITDLIYAGTLPTGEMLLAPKIATNNPLPIYKYDHIENKLLNWIQVEGYVPIDHARDYVQISYHEDNILPLDCLIRSQ